MFKITQNKCSRRVVKEFKKVIESDIADIIAVNDNFDHFNIRFTPKGGHYKDQTLILDLKTKHPSYNKSYPIKPPLMKMLIPVFHTNIHDTGIICVDFLLDSKNWSPLNSFTTVISAIKLLFDDPEFTHGHYRPEASKLYRECLNKNSFVEFDTKTKTYYDNAVKKGGYKHLEEFAKLYQEQFPDRIPVGL